MKNINETLKKLTRNGVLIKYDDIKRICLKYEISRLWVFGSSLNKFFNENSDIDILVEYQPDSNLTLIDEFHIQEEFMKLVNREVDLVSLNGLKNPILRKHIFNSMEIVYDHP